MSALATRLYPTHVPLGQTAKLVLTAGASLGAFMYPQRADLVAAVGELTGASALRALCARMEADATGAQILREQPLIRDDFMQTCRSAPPGSFGRAYGDFMAQRRFSASERPPVRFVDDARLAYVATRYRQVHDLWHVLFDCHTSLLGETALKALEFVQTGLPMTAASIAAGQSKLKPSDQVVLTTQLLPWAGRAGTQCHDLMTIYYEKHVGDDLEELRQRWRIIPAPSFVEAARAA